VAASSRRSRTDRQTTCTTNSPGDWSTSRRAGEVTGTSYLAIRQGTRQRHAGRHGRASESAKLPISSGAPAPVRAAGRGEPSQRGTTWPTRHPRSKT